MEDRKEFEMLLIDTQKEYRRSNKLKDKVIILLIVLLFLQSVVTFGGFIYYESQFENEVTEEKEVTLDTEGENASIDYSENNADGNIYNDNAVRNAVK